jgi:hypothetical protein
MYNLSDRMDELPKIMRNNKNIDLNPLHIIVWMKWGIKEKSFTFNELKNEIWRLYGLTENNWRDIDIIELIIQTLIDEQIIDYYVRTGTGNQRFILKPQ